MDPGSAEKSGDEQHPQAPRERKGPSDWLALVSFAAAIFAFGTLYGVVAARYELFPYPTLRAALAEALALKKRAFDVDAQIA